MIGGVRRRRAQLLSPSPKIILINSQALSYVEKVDVLSYFACYHPIDSHIFEDRASLLGSNFIFTKIITLISLPILVKI